MNKNSFHSNGDIAGSKGNIVTSHAAGPGSIPGISWLKVLSGVFPQQ